MQTRQPLDRLDLRERAAHPAARAQPLGQSRSHASSAATPASRSGTGTSCPITSIRATSTMRARTLRSASTRRCSPTSTPNAISLTPLYLAEGGGARRRVAPVRHPRVPDRALQRADRDRRLADRRSRRPGRQAVVAGEGRGDLPLHSRLRRLPGQGQLRRPARPAGLRPHARRRREHARRRAGALRRHRDVARVRLLERAARRPRQAGVQRVRAAGRQVPRQRAGAGQERPDRFPAARAVPSAVRRDAEARR